jgi:photosystem II stability/assembly factor-like uncharacterized protein
VFYSTDSGKSWEFKELPQDFIDFREVCFIDSIHGWAVGDKDFVVATNDGWQTWMTQSYGAPGYIANGVSFLDSLHGWVGGAGILATADGGNNWSLLLAVGAWSINFVDTLHGWLLRSDGSKQHIHTSSDGGQTWVEHSSPLHQEIREIKAFDSLQCWAIGVSVFPFSPRVWRTTDGGQSWITEYSGPGGTLLDLDMADGTHGVAVGDLGTVLIYAPLILGDLNADEEITGTDVVLELNKVFLDQPFPSPEEAGDVNCDNLFTSVDVVLLLNRAFLGISFPCTK